MSDNRYSNTTLKDALSASVRGLKGQDGYMDMQIPPIMIGIIILIGLVLVLTHSEYSSKVPVWMPYTGFGIVFVMFAFGFYINKDSLECPESPFNKHVSPFFLAVCVVGALSYAIWKVYGSSYHFLVFVFGTAIVITIFLSFYLDGVRQKTEEGGERKS